MRRDPRLAGDGQWAQQAGFFQTKEGDTRWGIKFEKGLSGGLGYRSVNFSYRHFPLYMKGLLFDKDMKPRITTPDGVQAIKDFAAAVEYMRAGKLGEVKLARSIVYGGRGSIGGPGQVEVPSGRLERGRLLPASTIAL